MFVDPPTLDAVLRGILLTSIAIVWVLVLARVEGLRSFSKMTAFDFVVTLAIASLLASASMCSSWSELAQPLAAIGTLFLIQFVLSLLRQRSAGFRKLIDNQPVVLARDGIIDESALRRLRIARTDVVAKLREANAHRLEDVRFVVLESTGDVSVLHGAPPVEPRLIDDLANLER